MSCTSTSPLPSSEALPVPIVGCKKSVSWNQLVTNREVKPIKTENGYDLWWTANDITGIKRECRIIVEILDRRGNSPERTEFCSRGLEGRTITASNLRRIRRVQCTTGVLREQQYQKDQSIRDDDEIAALYVNLCGSASHEAHLRGLQDQQHAATCEFQEGDEHEGSEKQQDNCLSSSMRMVVAQDSGSMLNLVAGRAA